MLSTLTTSTASNAAAVKHSFYIKVAGKTLGTIRAVDAAAAKRLYCAAHGEIAREFVKAVPAPEVYSQH